MCGFLCVCLCPCGNESAYVVFVEVEGVCGCLCAMQPSKPPTGGQAVTAQLIVVSIWAAGKGTMAASVLAYPLQL